METASLVCPARLAHGWSGLLERDGFAVEAGADPLRGAVAYAGRRFALAFRPEESGQYALALDTVRDRAAYRRLEAIVLASGAHYNLAVFASVPVRRLYRTAESGAAALLGALSAAGVAVGVRTAPAFGGAPGPRAEPRETGMLSRGPARVTFDTGPALEPAGAGAVRFVDLQPKFTFRMSSALVTLLDDIERELRGRGAERVSAPRQ